MRIVYVEDEPANLSLVERIAAADHFEVITYQDAESVLHNFEVDQPDLMIVDIALAGALDGLEMVRMIRGAGFTMPIIAVTSRAAEAECLEAGCNHYFVKPIPVNEFWQLLQHYAAEY